jgi:IclR family KDG regulon transcriptional repressor
MKIQSIDRVCHIISLFSSSNISMGVTEIAAALNLHKATVWGLVNSLEKHRFLQQDAETRKYGIGPKFYEMGMLYLTNLEINTKAFRPLHRLARLTHLSSYVGIWDHGTALITQVVHPGGEDSVSYQLGPRDHAYCTAIGKVFLPFLTEVELQAYLDSTPLIRYTNNTIVQKEALLKEIEIIRQQGYSVCREEMITGLAALGAPILGRNKRIAGSIGISGSPEAVLGDRSEKLAQELMRAASEISQAMGYYLNPGGQRRGTSQGGNHHDRQP